MLVNIDYNVEVLYDILEFNRPQDKRIIRDRIENDGIWFSDVDEYGYYESLVCRVSAYSPEFEQFQYNHNLF